jgi:hypothetical protein
LHSWEKIPFLSVLITYSLPGHDDVKAGRLAWGQ